MNSNLKYVLAILLLLSAGSVWASDDSGDMSPAAKVRQQADDLKAQQEAKEANLKQIRKLQEQTAEEMSEADQELADAKTKLSKTHAQELDQTQKLHVMESDEADHNLSVAKQIDQLKDQYRASEARIAAMNKQIQDIIDHTKKVDGDLKAAQNLKDETDQSRRDTMDRVSSVQDKYDKAVSDMRDMNVQVQKAKQALTDATSKEKDMNSKLARAQADEARTKSETDARISHLREQNRLLQEKTQEVEREIMKVKNHTRRMNDEAKAAESITHESAMRLQDAKRRLHDAMAEYHRLNRIKMASINQQ